MATTVSARLPVRSSVLLAVLLIGVAALAYGLMASLAKVALLEGSNPVAVTVVRSAVGLIIFGGYGLAVGQPLGLPRSMILLAGLMAASSAFASFTFVSATLTLDVGLTTLIVFLHPFLVALWYHLSGSTHLTGQQLLWSALAFLGLAVALSVDFGHLSPVGLAYAAASSVLCTVMLLTLVRLNKEVGGLVTCFYAAAGSLAIFGVGGALGIDGGMVWPQSAMGWAAAVGVGLSFAACYFCWLVGARLIGGSRAALLSFAEPVAAILVALLLLGEVLTPVQWGGVALVALGLFLLEARPGRKAT